MRVAAARGLRALSLATSLMLPAFDAAALLDDQLELFVGETVTTDSNLFRISKDRDPNAFLGSAQKSDTYTTTTAGFSLNVPVSRQRFQAGLTMNDVRYSRFADLSYQGRDGRLLWLWQAGNEASGQLGYAETKTQASFSNFQGRTANPLETRRTFGTAAYLLTPSWELRGGLSNQEQRNGNATRRENDVDILVTDLALSYISTADNKIGPALRREDGRYPIQQSVGGRLYDNRYVQHALGVATEWTMSGKSRLTARLDQVRRDYDQLSQRNFERTTYRAAYDWLATGKLALNVLAFKEVGAAEDIQTSYVLIDGFGLRPSYDLSDKIKLTAAADFTTRQYLGDPGLVLGTATDRKDRVRAASLTMTYKPMRSLTVTLSGQREARSSNAAFGDYAANILSVGARFAF